MERIGRYRLLEQLASGGMAEVWLAEVEQAAGVTKRCALKLVRGDRAGDAGFRRMFVQEARLAALLSHANVVQTFDFDEEGGRFFIAMELVRGQHLGRVVERCREQGLRLGLARAVHVCAEVAKGLAHAHRLTERGRPLGIVHRDVSPHNVLVSYEGEVKLADFGIAKAMGLAGVTSPGTLKGKIAYMAPEQARGDAVDGRADVYSLGVVLWELCTGRRLFARESEAATLAAVLAGEVVSAPSAWNEDVPADLDAIVLEALERDPGRRTRSADRLSAALSGVLLRLARTHEDVDLRALMARLWPEEDGSAARRAPERTVVRPPPSDPGARARQGAAARAPAGAGEGGAAAPGPAPEEATAGPTVAAPRPARPGAARSRGRAVAGVALAAAVAAAAGVGALRVARTVETPGPAPGPAGDARAPGEAAAAPEPASAGSAPEAPPPAPDAPSPAAAVAPALPEAGAPLGGAAGTVPDAVPAPGDPAAPAAQAARARAGAPGGGAGVLSVHHQWGQLPVPDAATGEGLLLVDGRPWGSVTVNGRALGEGPITLRVRAGTYRVRVTHELGVQDRTVTVRPGARAEWTALFQR